MGKAPSVPWLFQAHERADGYEAGADACLSKPVDDRLLLAVIQQKWDRLMDSPH